MKLGRLACHVAELTHFATANAKSDSMDFAKGEYIIDAGNRQQLLDAFDKAAAGARGHRRIERREACQALVVADGGQAAGHHAESWSSALRDDEPFDSSSWATICILATYGYASAFDLRSFGG